MHECLHTYIRMHMLTIPYMLTMIIMGIEALQLQRILCPIFLLFTYTYFYFHLRTILVSHTFDLNTPRWTLTNLYILPQNRKRSEFLRDISGSEVLSGPLQKCLPCRMHEKLCMCVPEEIAEAKCSLGFLENRPVTRVGVSHWKEQNKSFKSLSLFSPSLDHFVLYSFSLFFYGIGMPSHSVGTSSGLY